MWKVTAGRGNVFVSDFLSRSIVAIGWSEAGNYVDVPTRTALIARFTATWPEQTTRQIQVGAGQVWRFLREVRVGDDVLTYDPDSRLYHVGRVLGSPEYQPEVNDRLPVVRRVEWLEAVSRDQLSAATKNTLGAILTLFRLSDVAAEEVTRLAAGNEKRDEFLAPVVVDETTAGIDLFADIAEQALERIKDRILSLTWDELQELVAALLRALGYRTIVSPAGPDRGRDIIASRDGF